MKRTRILSLFLAIALVATMATSHITTAFAAGEPTATVTTSEELLAAIADAEDGAVIGIDGQITFDASMILGDENKKITLQKVNPNSSIYISSTCSATIKNIIFDGAELEGTQPFLQSDSYAWVEDCTFQNHSSTGSGAVAIWNGTIEFYNCLFENNTASQGGHISIDGMCNGIFEDCTFKNGSASFGGGAIVSSGTCRIKNCLFADNNGTTVGGAIRNSGVLTIENSKFNGNVAEIGSDIATGTGNPVTFIDSAAELNALYAADGVTAEWVTGTILNPEHGDYITWELVLTAIPEEPTEPEQPDEPTPPTEPVTPTEPTQPNNTNNSVESNPSTKITVDEPLGNVENHITVTTPSDNAAQAYINGYMAGNGQGGTSTPIEQTIRVEAAQAPTDNPSDPNSLNINITVGSDLPQSTEAVQAEPQITWYHVAVLCLLVAILCFLISFLINSCYNYRKTKKEKQKPKEQGGNSMLFSKKAKNPSEMNIIHYEGLQGFRQDFPCTVKLDDEVLTFSNKEGFTISLAYSKLQSIDFMPEPNYMSKYHNNYVSTAKTKAAVKWFYVINYISSSGEAKHIAFWGVDLKTSKFFDEIKTKVVPQTHIDL